MRYLCIGCGSIGKRHMRNLISIGVNPEQIAAMDPREDRLKEVEQMGVNSLFSNFEDAVNSNNYDAAFICSPTNLIPFPL